jgi:hypothetical protein
MDRELVSPADLAGLAVRLATLKGLTEPDMAGAVALLKQAVGACEEITVLKCAGMRLARSPKPLQVSAVRILEAKDKQFPGAEMICEPETYPATLDEALRLISGEYSRKRREDFVRRMFRAKQVLDETEWALPVEIEDAVEFWELARDLAPHCPKFSHLYADEDAVPGAKTKKSGKGRAKSKKSANGEKGS